MELMDFALFRRLVSSIRSEHANIEAGVIVADALTDRGRDRLRGLHNLWPPRQGTSTRRMLSR
jgi:hypothetical protein